MFGSHDALLPQALGFYMNRLVFIITCYATQSHNDLQKNKL